MMGRRTKMVRPSRFGLRRGALDRHQAPFVNSWSEVDRRKTRFDGRKTRFDQRQPRFGFGARRFRLRRSRLHESKSPFLRDGSRVDLRWSVTGQSRSDSFLGQRRSRLSSRRFHLDRRRSRGGRSDSRPRGWRSCPSKSRCDETERRSLGSQSIFRQSKSGLVQSRRRFFESWSRPCVVCGRNRD